MGKREANFQTNKYTFRAKGERTASLPHLEEEDKANMANRIQQRAMRIMRYAWAGICIVLLLLVASDTYRSLTFPEAYPFGAENVSIIYRDLPTYVGANALLALWLVMGIALAFFIRHRRRGSLTLAHALITLGMLLVSALPE